MEHFGDPGFHYSANIAQLWGVLATRLADSELLPLDFVPYADLILDALAALANVVSPGRGPDTGDGAALDVTAAQRKARAFRDAAVAFRAAGARLLGQRVAPANRRPEGAPAVDDALDRGAMAVLDRAAMAVESNWAVPGGLPGRPWSRHILHGTRATFAPVLLPGVTEAIERGDWQLARDQLALLAAALDRNTALLHAASATAGLPPR